MKCRRRWIIAMGLSFALGAWSASGTPCAGQSADNAFRPPAGDPSPADAQQTDAPEADDWIGFQEPPTDAAESQASARLQISPPSLPDPIAAVQPAPSPDEHVPAITQPATLPPTTLQPADDALAPASVLEPSFGGAYTATQTSPSHVSAQDVLDALRLTDDLIQPLGQPTTLVEALGQTHPQTHRAVVAGYWQVFAKSAELRSTVDQRAWLDAVGRPASSVDQALLAAARMECANRRIEAEMSVESATTELAGLLGRGDQPQPLAADRPWVGPYETQYQFYVAGGRGPRHAEQLHDAIGKQYPLVASRAESLRACRQAVSQAGQAYQTGQASLATLLEAIRLYDTSARQFIVAVTRYNQQIAEYALTVAPPQPTPQRVAAMLIPTSDDVELAHSTPPAQQPSSVRPSLAPVSHNAPITTSPSPSPYVQSSLSGPPSGFGGNSALPSPLVPQGNPSASPSSTPSAPTPQQQQPPYSANGGAFDGFRR